MQNQLEKYLSQIEKQLSALPTEQRQEELCEIRLHLEMMIEENIARGFEADEAIAKALEQFGAAKKVGHDLKFPLESERSFLLKNRFRVFGILAGIVALDVMFQFHHLPSIPSSFNNWWSVVVAFLLGWTIAFFERRKTTSFFRICVTFCYIIILTFLGVFWGFTSPQDFTIVALVAGYHISLWQKSRHSVVAN